MYYNIYLILTEIISVMLFLVILHWFRRSLGNIPMYFTLGLLAIFGEVATQSSLVQFFMEDGKLSYLGYGMLFLPVVVMYLIIYEEEGTLEAHRFIFGLIVAILGFVHIAMLFIGQSRIEAGDNATSLLAIITNGPNFILPFFVSVTTHILLFLLVPISYQFLRNYSVPVGCAMFLHVCLFIIAGFFVRAMLPNAVMPVISNEFRVYWCIGVGLLCIIAHFYTRVLVVKNKKRNPFAILLTLSRHLRHSSRIRQSVEEWADKYQIVFDNCREMFFVLEEDGSVVNANHSAVSAFGPILYETGFYLTSAISHPNGTAFDWKGTWRECQRNGTDLQTSFSNLMLRLPDGRQRRVAFNITPAVFNDIDIAIIVMRDITAQVEHEREQKRLEEQLIHSQRMEAVGMLAGGIAHDFNNLLQGMQASLEYLDKEQLTDKGKGMLGNIRNASKHTADMISKLLGFARKGKYEVQRLDLRDVARRSSELFMVGVKNLEFKFLASPEAIMVNGDETQLQQVILNLLINSRDALSQEPGARRKISLRIENAVEDMPAWQRRPALDRKAEDYVLFRVKDTGTGMSAETQSRIFEPFYSTKGSKGTGMGMAMVYGCVTHHRGWIDIASTLDVGTEITVFLPKAK